MAEAINPPEKVLPTRDEIAQHLKVINKDGELVSYVPNRAQRDFLAKRTGRDLILKARQLGFSTAIQADNFIDAETRTSLQATLAHDIPTTQKLRRMAKNFYNNLPANLRLTRGYDNAMTTTYKESSSEVTIATAGSLNMGRGGTYTKVHGSEVAYWKDAEAIMKGLMQGVAKGGQIALESTPNGAQGWFYDRCMEALDGKGSWTLHFYAWWWDDEYRLDLELGETITYTEDEQRLVADHKLTPEQIKWRRGKQQELKGDFIQEYPEDPVTCFLTSGNGYFSNITKVKDIFRAARLPAPRPRHRHVAGLDYGQTNDYTALSIIDTDYLEEVCLWRDNNLPPKEIRRRIIRLLVQWNVRVVVVEKNSIGRDLIAELIDDLADAKLDVKVVPFWTDPKRKRKIITGLHYSLDEEGLQLQSDAEGRQEIYNFISRQTSNGGWQYEAESGHDDTVIARALANYARDVNPTAESYQG
jgi:hypothetical protein